MDNQISGDPNAWYKDPDHPLYYSSDAHKKRADLRASIRKRQDTLKKNKAARELVEQRLGKDLANTVVDRLMALMSPWDFGIGKPFHMNGKTAFHPRKLRRSDIFNHLAGTDKTKRLYYTCRPFEPDTESGVSLCMVTIDIDNHGHASNEESNAADQVALDICKRLDDIGVSYLRQPSTNGNGFHVTLLVSVPSSLTQESIRARLVDLRTALAALYECSGCHEVCLKGLNLLRGSAEVSLYGTLVRLPEISTITHAESFVSMTEAPAALQAIAPIFACDENGGSESGCSSDCVDEGEAESLHTITRGTTSVVSDSESHKRGGMNPLKRMHEALRQYRESHFSNPSSPEELVAYYEQLDLHTGKATPARLDRAKLVWTWALERNRSLPTIESWHARVARIFKDADLTYTKGRSIKLEEAAVFGFLLATKLQSNDEAQIPTSYVKMGSLALKKNGQSNLSLNDNKKIAKLFRLFLRHGLIEQTRNHIKGNEGIPGQCRMFRKGSNWSAAVTLPKPPQSPPKEKEQTARQQESACVRTAPRAAVCHPDGYAWAENPPL